MQAIAVSVAVAIADGAQKCSAAQRTRLPRSGGGDESWLGHAASCAPPALVTHRDSVNVYCEVVELRAERVFSGRILEEWRLSISDK